MIVFEIGKFYQHSGGGKLHILGELDTTMWGKLCLIAEEDGDSILRPVGKDEASAFNWQEITKKEWMKSFS